MNLLKKYNILLLGDTELEVFFLKKLNKSKYKPTTFLHSNNLSDTELLAYINKHKINLVVCLSDLLSSQVFDTLAKKRIKTVGIDKTFFISISEIIKKQITKKYIDEELSILYFWDKKKLTHIATTENYKDEKSKNADNPEMPAAFPVNVSAKTSKLIQEHTMNLAEVLSKEKANFKGYICSTFSENENVINFGFKQNISLGIAAFSSFFFDNKKDIIDILLKTSTQQ